MTQVKNWFDRKFEFTFPVELYPDLCVRLRGTPARLEEMVRGCPPESLVQAAREKWSAQEHVGHLADVEPLWMARVNDYIVHRSQLTVADLTNQKTFVANHNARALEEILAEFRYKRLCLVDALDPLDPTQFASAIPHPRLKVPMRLVDHVFFVAEHDDHHLAIIWLMIRDK